MQADVREWVTAHSTALLLAAFVTAGAVARLLTLGLQRRANVAAP